MAWLHSFNVGAFETTQLSYTISCGDIKVLQEVRVQQSISPIHPYLLIS
jgi:hypothetical protein